jgi:hypothetical protein
MEIPSFAIAVLLFPTHFRVHILHFILHGYDGASNHSGFAAPGILGYLFDGEYHYYHRKYMGLLFDCTQPPPPPHLLCCHLVKNLSLL